MLEKEIKGILHLESESDLWDEAVKNKEASLGVKLSLDWEHDTITGLLMDKDGNHFGVLEFDCTDFHKLADEVMPPSIDSEEMNREPTEEEKKDMQEDAEEYLKNPIKETIAKYHSEE